MSTESATTINMPQSALAGIRTKFLGPTNYRGSRIKATRTDHASGDKTVTVSYDHALKSFENHAAAAQALADKYEWAGTYSAASVDGGYVFARQAR